MYKYEPIHCQMSLTVISVTSSACQSLLFSTSVNRKRHYVKTIGLVNKSKKNIK